jgi:hypothetical protein
VEQKHIKSDRFIVTAGQDNNINLHRLSNGVFIGQFGQATIWNIHDMSPYKDRKPRFVREWYIKLRQRMKELKALDDQREKLELEQQEELPIQG